MKTLFAFLVLSIMGVYHVLGQVTSHSLQLVVTSQNAIRTTDPILDHSFDFLHNLSFGITGTKELSKSVKLGLGINYANRRFFGSRSYNHGLFSDAQIVTADMRYLSSYAYHSLEVPISLNKQLSTQGSWTKSVNLIGMSTANFSGTYYHLRRLSSKYGTGFTPFSFALFAEFAFEQKLTKDLVIEISPNIRLLNIMKGDPVIYSLSEPSVWVANSAGVRASIKFNLL